MDNFGCGSVARIRHDRPRFKQRLGSVGESLRKLDAAPRNLDVFVREARIGQPVAKGEQRAVGDINIAGEEACAVAWRL